MARSREEADLDRPESRDSSFSLLRGIAYREDHSHEHEPEGDQHECEDIFSGEQPAREDTGEQTADSTEIVAADDP